MESLSEYLEDAPAIVKNAGTDLKLSVTGDLILTDTADFDVSEGYDNIVQAIQLILSSEKGTLFHHPEYGIQNQICTKFISAAEQKKTISENIVKAIEKDPRFNKVSNIAIKEISNENNPNAPKGFELSMNIYVSGTSNPIPIQFRL